jgi:hypothetical protein
VNKKGNRNTDKYVTTSRKKRKGNVDLPFISLRREFLAGNICFKESFFWPQSSEISDGNFADVKGHCYLTQSILLF